jgi:hypothetical protein
MATLRGAARLTEELQEAVNRLHEELTNGDGDFASLTKLADRVGEAADDIASTFAQLDRILVERVLGRGAEAEGEEEAEGGRAKGNGEGETSREELLKRAKKADIPGRSSMSREALESALEEVEGKSKEELLEEARKLGIPGRSSMTKDELRKALRAEERLSKEELLERARDADLPGRAEMSKDELREALRTS